MNKTTLYGITKQDAKTLLQHCNNDVAVLGLLLWNNGRANSIERGIYKANKLVRFISN